MALLSTNNRLRHSRREFLIRTGSAACAGVLLPGTLAAAEPAESYPPPIAVFSKVFQSLRLDFEAAARLAQEAGLDGIDCPVRPAGEIEPADSAKSLPRYAGRLQERGLRILLITTAITGPTSAEAEKILETARRIGVRYYRLGSLSKSRTEPDRQLADVKAALRDLAELNARIGMTAIFQNHSPSGNAYVGGDLGELESIVRGFPPELIGVAFDLGHALIVHGANWRRHFEQLKSHIKVVYIKDVDKAGNWVPFGQGQIAQTGFFGLLKKMGYRAPISLHIEFDWESGGKDRTRENLARVLRNSHAVLRKWLAEA